MYNQSLAIRELPETQRSLAFSGISGTYARVGTPLVNSSIKLVLQNQTDAPITFSWDGLNDHITLAAGSVFTSDVQANHGKAETMQSAAGTQFWVKQVSAPTSGFVYITSFYGATFSI